MTRRACVLLQLAALTGATALPLVAPVRPAHASTVLALSLEELTKRSDVIAVAVPAESQSRRDADGSLIVTDVSLRVETALKGVKAGAQLIATVLGGELDGIALQVPGEASFTVGQRVIVFLTRTPDQAELRVVGMSQGVLPVVGTNAQPMVAPGGATAALVQPGSDGILHDAPAALTQPQPLSDLLTKLRALINGTSAARSPKH